jgi:hypothetical protein
VNKACSQIQEKIACAINLELSDQIHLVECINCQNVFSDYQILMVALNEEGQDVKIPESFADGVMKSIAQIQTRDDWYDRFIGQLARWLEVPLVQYGSLAAGFGVGILTFLRFVAFVFIPA